MRKACYIILLLLVLPLCRVSPQADTLGRGKLKVSGAYLGAGFGVVNKGLGGVMSVTTLLSNNWGFSLRYNPNGFEPGNMPDDYIDLVLGFPLLTNGIPVDQLNAFSLHMVKEFNTKSNLVRLGIEAGPSFVRYIEAIFTPVDNYIPLLGSNYDVTFKKDNGIGFSMRFKAEFPFTRFAGLETSPYLCIDRFRTFLGMDFILTLGFVK